MRRQLPAIAPSAQFGSAGIANAIGNLMIVHNNKKNAMDTGRVLDLHALDSASGISQV
jgi:hypothetical protein